MFRFSRKDYIILVTLVTFVILLTKNALRHWKRSFSSYKVGLNFVTFGHNFVMFVIFSY